MSQYPPPGYIAIESRVPGIDVFMPAPPAADTAPAEVEFKCPRCGATTAFSIQAGSLACSYCGFTEAAQPEAQKATVVGRAAAEEEFTPAKLAAAERGWGAERRELACQSCGAVATVPADTMTHTCAFCASNKVIQRPAAADALRPTYLAPFKVTPESCLAIARKWLGSSWMTPKSLDKAADMGFFTPVYLPYWTFDAHTSANWKAQVGHTRTERYYNASSKSWETRTRIDWRWESGRVALTHDDLIQPGTKRLSAMHLGKINAFDLRDLVEYEAKFLAGMQALNYDIDLDAAWALGRDTMRERTREACRSQASTSMIRNFSMNLDFSDESWRYILLPVYIAAYRYQEKVYQVLLNGQTGVISGPRPVDWNKIWLVIAALLAPGLLTGLAALITLALGIGVAIGGVAFVLLAVGVVISIIIAVQANALDDA